MSCSLTDDDEFEDQNNAVLRRPILKKPEALKCPPAHPDLLTAVITRLKIVQIPVVWTSVTSAHIGEHFMLEVWHFWRVENLIFGIGRREKWSSNTAKLSATPHLIDKNLP